jgi:transposase
VNRLHKVLESANIKLGAVATAVMGVSGREMLAALLGGEQDPAVLAELARGKLRRKLPELRRALEGRVQPHHLVLLGRILAHIDFLEESLTEVGQEIERVITPFGEATTLLRTIPGVDQVAVATLVAEIGTDPERFPSAKHLASWAGLCPGNRESAGKRLGSKTMPGDSWLKAVLEEVAWAIARHKRDNYLTARYHRLARKRGKHKAAVAVMHSVLVIAYHILQEKRPYSDLGADYFDTLDKMRLERYYVNRLTSLGYEVTLQWRAA